MALFRFNFGDDADKSIFESGSNTDFHLYTRTTGTARTVFAGICVTGNSYLGNAAGDTTTVCGNLVVTGNTTTINSTTLQVDDKNIELGTVDTPDDTTADGGGITLKGATDKTILWTNSTDRWHFNQGIDITGVSKICGTGSGTLLLEGANAGLQICDTSDTTALYRMFVNGTELRTSHTDASFPTGYTTLDSAGNFGIGVQANVKLHVGGVACVDTCVQSPYIFSETVCTTNKVIAGGTGHMKLDLAGASDPYIYFREGATTGKAYIQWTASTGSLDFRNYETGGFVVKSMTDSTWWQMQTNTSVVRGSFYADCTDSIGILAVSYTHLTLPTNREV